MNKNMNYSDDIFEFIDSYLSEDEIEFEDLLSHISIEILSKRIDLEMNQRDFAKLLGVSQPMVSKLESNTYNPTIKQLYKTCKALDFDLKIDLKPKVSECNIKKVWLDNATSSKQKFSKSNDVYSNCA